MSLRIAVAAPFQQRGRDRIGESEFVVALSLDRDWFSPDQAKRLVDVAVERDLVSRDDGDLVAAFDTDAVTVPDDFMPDDDLLQERSTFERVLDTLVAAGVEKQVAVGRINELQQQLDVTVEAAAVVYARRQGVNVDETAAVALDDMRA